MSLILYVEDDALLQTDGEAVLTSAGYEVVLAMDGAEGCEALRRLGERVSALITDVRLQGAIDGWQVAAFGRGMIENLPVVYVTASEADDFATRGVAQSLLVSKPFDWPQVVSSVSLLLRA